MTMSQQLILDLLPPSPPSLDNFVPGGNAQALDALSRCSPGHAIYLWGAPGAGRTHLLRACAERADAIYIEPSDAADMLRDAAMADTPPFRLLAVDDVERLDDSAQAALFSLYNRWREVAATPLAFALVLSGNRAPLSMPLREDLRTRLGWDLVFRLELLSDAERAQALETRALERGLRLAPEVINWILTHHSRDMRLLSALLDALDRYSMEKQRAITLPLLKDLLRTAPPSPNAG